MSIESAWLVKMEQYKDLQREAAQERQSAALRAVQRMPSLSNRLAATLRRLTAHQQQTQPAICCAATAC